MRDFTLELNRKYAELVQQLCLQVSLVFELSLPNLLFELETWLFFATLGRIYILVRQRRQLCCILDYPKYLFLSLNDFLYLLSAEFIVFDGRLYWTVYRNLFLILRCSQVGVTFWNTFDFADFNWVDKFEVVCKRVLNVKSLILFLLEFIDFLRFVCFFLLFLMPSHKRFS